MAPSRPVAIGKKPRERLPPYGFERQLAQQKQGIVAPWARAWKVQKRVLLPKDPPPPPSPPPRRPHPRVLPTNKQDHPTKAAPPNKQVRTSQLLQLRPVAKPKVPLFPEGGLPIPRVRPKKRKRDLTDEELDFHLPVPGEWPLQAGRERKFTAAEAARLPLWDQRSWRAPQFLEAEREEQRAFSATVCNRVWRFTGQPATIAGLRATAALSEIRTDLGLASAIVAARVDDGFRYSVKYGEKQIRTGKRRCLETWTAARSPLAHFLRRVKLLRPERPSAAVRRAILQAKPVVRYPATPPLPIRTPRFPRKFIDFNASSIGHLNELSPIPEVSSVSTDRRGDSEETNHPHSPSAQLKEELDLYIQQHPATHIVEGHRGAEYSIERVSEWLEEQSKEQEPVEEQALLSVEEQTVYDIEKQTATGIGQQVVTNIGQQAVHDRESLGSHIVEESGLEQTEQLKELQGKEPKLSEGSQEKVSVHSDAPYDLPPTYLCTPPCRISMAEKVPSSSELVQDIVDRKRRRTGRFSLSPRDALARTKATCEIASGSPASLDRASSRSQFLPLRRIASDRMPEAVKSPARASIQSPRSGAGRANASALGQQSKGRFSLAASFKPFWSLRSNESPADTTKLAQTTGDADPPFSRSSSLENRVDLRPGSAAGAVMSSSWQQATEGEVELGLTDSGRGAPSPPDVGSPEKETNAALEIAGKAQAEASTSAPGEEDTPTRDDNSGTANPFVSSYHDESGDEKSSSATNLRQRMEDMSLKPADASPVQASTRRSTRLHNKELQKKQALAKKQKEKFAAEQSFKKAQDEFERLSAPGDTPALPGLEKKWAKKLIEEMDAAMAPTTQLATSLTMTALNRHAFGTCVPRAGDSASGWLNDEIIFAYLEHIVAYAKGETKNNPRPKQVKDGVPLYASFNSQFWSKMESQGAASVARWPNRMGLKGERLLKPELIFIPINSGLHWTLLALYPRRRKAVYYDSMGNSAGQKEKTLRSFLSNHLKESYIAEEWTFDVADSPQQNNGSDCGVFAITNARMLALGWEPRSSFGHSDMATQRRRILCELMNGGFHGDFAPPDALAEHLKQMTELRAKKESLEAEIEKLN